MRSEATNFLERQAFSNGFKSVAGVDEAGRGPLAGPVVAAAVIFEHDDYPGGIKDSKQLSGKMRQKLFVEICKRAAAIGVGIVSEKVIDRINILRATQRAMLRAVMGLKIKPDLVLIDGMRVPQMNIVQRGIPDGDRISVSIAGASIIAKVTRDRIMIEKNAVYPEYGFASHKGYGTKKHLDALQEYGPCSIHRMSFRPVSLAKRLQP